MNKKKIVIGVLSVALVLSVGLGIYLLCSNIEAQNNLIKLQEEFNNIKISYENELNEINAQISESEKNIINLEQKVADYEKQEQERLEAERKAREEEAARKEAEKVDKKNQPGGSYKAEEPVKQDPPSEGENPEESSSSNNSGGSSSGGGRLGGLSGGSSSYTGSIVIN